MEVVLFKPCQLKQELLEPEYATQTAHCHKKITLYELEGVEHMGYVSLKMNSRVQTMFF